MGDIIKRISAHWFKTGYKCIQCGKELHGYNHEYPGPCECGSTLHEKKYHQFLKQDMQIVELVEDDTRTAEELLALLK